MEAFLFSDIIKSVHAGDVIRIVLDLVLLFIVWRAVSKLQLSVDKLSTVIGLGFKKGEDRFDKIEQTQNAFDVRLAGVERKLKPQGA